MNETSIETRSTAPAVRDRIRKLVRAMTRGAYERERVIALGLLCAMTGESLFLLGAPGVGKSMVARRLKLAFRDASAFEYLMSRFSTPDEIFGPVSITKLKDRDTYERITTGYLPSAEVVFLDEIWKAGPAIQNALLTVLNEKIFLNGNREMRLPLKGIVAASNELPARGEGLEALWDRFLVRLVVRPIAGREAFGRMIVGSEAEGAEVPRAWQVTPAEYERYAAEIREIEVPPRVVDLLCTVRERIDRQRRLDSAESDEPRVPYVSDRRWRKIVGLLRGAAFLNGRRRVEPEDCLLLCDTLWEHDGQCEAVDRLVCDVLGEAVYSDLHGLLTMNDSFREQLVAGRRMRPRPRSTDGRHYIILCDGERLRIAIADYEALTAEASWGRFAADSTIIRSEEPAELRLQRGGTEAEICINGMRYPLEGHDAEFSLQDYAARAIGRMRERREELRRAVEAHLFLRPYASYDLEAVYRLMKRRTEELVAKLSV